MEAFIVFPTPSSLFHGHENTTLENFTAAAAFSSSFPIPTKATSTGTTSASAAGWKSPEFTWVEYVGMVLSVLIFCVGTAGNALTVVIMRRKPFLASSACVYLPCMAIFDSIFLTTGIPFEWVSWFQVDIDAWSCRFHRFVFYGSGDVSVWILVAFTFDRFVAVCFPFKKRFFCEPRKAAITVAVCALLGVAKNLHLFWTRGVETKGDVVVRSCGQVEEYRRFEKYVRPWIAFVTVSVIPFISIVVFNSSIVHHLIKSKKSRPESFVGKRSTVISNNKSSIYNNSNSINSSSNNNINNSIRGDGASVKKGARKQGGSRTFYQTTAMCLSVSFAFLIFIAPSIVIHIGKPHWKKNPLYDPIKTINNMLFYANHGINFYLYCLTGVRFRSELQVLCGRRAKKPYTILTGLNPRLASTRPSIMSSEAKDSTLSMEQEDERQGFADAAIALALRRDMSTPVEEKEKEEASE